MSENGEIYQEAVWEVQMIWRCARMRPWSRESGETEDRFRGMVLEH